MHWAMTRSFVEYIESLGEPVLEWPTGRSDLWVLAIVIGDPRVVVIHGEGNAEPFFPAWAQTMNGRIG